MSDENTVQAATLSLSDEQIKNHIKPLPDNKLLVLLHKLIRAFLTRWYDFADNHPKSSNIIYMISFFLIFSAGVSIWQFIVMTFMPYWFGSLNQVDFIWPAVAIPGLFDPKGNQLFYAIFNEPAAAVGQLGGLGNFIAFEIAVFTAQCINLPLQRNITFRSHGNIYIQAMWYFIGWIGVSLFLNALWGIVNPLLISWNVNYVIIGFVKTILTGFISMAIFFPIFLVIFPDYNAVAKRLQKKVDKLKAKNAAVDVIAEKDKLLKEAQRKAIISNAEKEADKTASQASSRAIAYFAVIESIEKIQHALKNQQDASNVQKLSEELKELQNKKPLRYTQAVKAIEQKEQALLNYNAIKNQPANA